MSAYDKKRREVLQKGADALGSRTPQSVLEAMSIAELSARYDRLTEWRGRVIRYYDECPDGDPRKAGARAQLDEIGARVVAVERAIGVVLDREES